jgi:hypothetical protein
MRRLMIIAAAFALQPVAASAGLTFTSKNWTVIGSDAYKHFLPHCEMFATTELPSGTVRFDIEKGREGLQMQLASTSPLSGPSFSGPFSYKIPIFTTVWVDGAVRLRPLKKNGRKLGSS